MVPGGPRVLGPLPCWGWSRRPGSPCSGSVPGDHPNVTTWTRVFTVQDSRAEVLVAQMDGQAFAQHAVDPTMSDLPEGYFGDVEQAAYRAGRPMLGWVEWAASFGGRRPFLAPTILAITAISIGLLPLALGVVADALGRDLRRPELLLLAPACIANLRWPGLCEPMATVLVLLGLGRWCQGRRSVAILCFVLAALTRETTLLIPAGIGLAELASTRRLRPGLPLAIPALAYLAWMRVVSWRIGAPVGGGKQMGLPLVGLLRAVPHWGLPEAATFAALLACAVLLWRSGEAIFRWILLVHLSFLLFVEALVWWYWWGFGRITLPLFALALVGARLPQGSPPVESGSPDAPTDVSDASWARSVAAIQTSPTSDATSTR